MEGDLVSSLAIFNLIYFTSVPIFMFLGWFMRKGEVDSLRARIRVYQKSEEFQEFLRDRGGRNLQ